MGGNLRLEAAVITAIIGFAGPGAMAAELSVSDIVERLQVPEDEVSFNSRGLQPSRPEADQPYSGRISDMQVLFEFNSAVLTAAARDELDKYGAALGSPGLADQSFLIAGHTDTVGSDSYNQALSERRAASVVDYLTGNYGVGADRLTLKGYGESQLADPANPTSARNRRVEIVNARLLY